jgi:hypothetical protein
MTVKYWAGFITPAIIAANPYTWATHWLNKATKAETAGNELIIIEVPKMELTECIKTIEQSLELYLRLDVG